MIARIIAVAPGAQQMHSKYARRSQYAREVLLPLVRGLSAVRECAIFDAVTPAQIRVADNFLHVQGLPSVRLGTHGCAGNFMSNVALWMECAAGDETMLILEDDARLEPGHVGTVDAACAGLRPADGKRVLYLLSECPYQQSMKRYAASQLEAVPGAPGLRRVVRCSDTAGTAAYALTPDAAKSLLAALPERTHGPTDWYLNTAAMQRQDVEIVVPAEYQKCFTLHEVWEPWNHLHEPGAYAP